MDGAAHRHFGWREVRNLAVGFLFLGVLAAVVYPAITTVHSNCGPGASCLSCIKQIDMATLMYAGDFDDRLPLQSGWATNLSPYTRQKRIFACPFLDTRGGKTFGHAFRRSLGGVDTKAVALPEEVPAFFDSTDLSWNAACGLDAIPAVGRSFGGKNSIGFLDGHTKWMTRRQLLAAAADRHIH